MWVKIVGIQNMDFENQNRERIQGYKFHVMYKDANVEGRAVNTLSIMNGRLGYAAALTAKVGDTMFVTYNNRGKLDYFGFDDPDDDKDI